jgi:hypothetical protein
MEQQFSKEQAPQPGIDAFASGQSLTSPAPQSSLRQSEPQSTQSLFGNAATAAAPSSSQATNFSSLQSSFGNAAVAQSTTAPAALSPLQSPATVQPTNVSTTPPPIVSPPAIEAPADKTAPIAELAATPATAVKEAAPAGKEPAAKVVPGPGAPATAAAPSAGAPPEKAEKAEAAGKAGAKPAAKGEGAKVEAAKEKAGAKEKGAGGGAEKAPPTPREAIAPTIGAVHQRAKVARKHSDPARAPVDNAQAAAISKGTEQQRSASTATVKNLGTAKDQAKPVERDDFRSKLKQAIKDATPQPTSESAAKEVIKTGGTKASAQMRDQLSTQRDTAEGPLKGAAQTEVTPDSQLAPKETGLKPEPLGAPPAPVSAAPVVPAPLPPERLDYSKDREPTDNAMAENNVNKDQLEKGNEPEFNKTLSERKNVEKQEAATEAKYRKSETQIQGQTLAAAGKEIKGELGGMQNARSEQIGLVVDQQTGTQDKDSKERKRITDKITEIKNNTRKDVESILTVMEQQAVIFFDLGLRSAEAAYERTFEDAKGGTWTWLTTWGDDWDDLITHSLQKARDQYFVEVDKAIDKVADLVDGMLKAAKLRVTNGLTEVENFVKGLDDSVIQFGQDALTEVTADFEAMTKEIDERRDALVNALVDQYKASFKRMNEMEERLREANKSLWRRIYDATVGLIKKIIAFKDMLMNILAKAADVVLDIISDPIGFLGNLVDGIKLGVENFSTNIVTHLKQGLMEWLFGAMGEAGITLPESFDLKGILSLVLQVLGLTYANIRARAVELLGENVVSALETAAEIFKILITEGPAGLWEYIQEKIGDLKTMVLEGIETFIVESIIKAGILWIVSLLNPASAFFKACKAIYDIIKFFIERGSQIIALIEAIIDSVGAIAKGNIAVAAKYVEDALAKAIPVVIGFLASLLGLGGISEKIKEIIEKIRAPINAVIDWVIQKAVDLVKAAGKLLGVGKKKEEQQQPVKTDDPEHDLKVEAGLAAIDQEDAQHLDKEGNISHEEADKVAHKVKLDHPIFKTLTVVEGKQTWDYEYSASAHTTHTGARRAPSADQLALEKLVAREKVNYPADGLGRAKGPHGHIPKKKLGGDRESLPATSTLPGGTPAYQPGDHRGHLIGDRFGGEARDENLVPMHPTLNLSSFKKDENTLATDYEAAMKDRKAALLHMHIIPKYLSNDRTEGASYRPGSVGGTAVLATLKKGASPAEAETTNYPIGPHNNDDSGSVRVEVNFNTSPASEIAQLPGIGEALARRIVAERKTRRGPYWEYKDLMERVEGIGQTKIDKILQAPNVRVRIR